MFGNIIAGQYSEKGEKRFVSQNPSTKNKLNHSFVCATVDEINLAVKAAKEASQTLRQIEGKQKAKFLRSIVKNILDLDDELVQMAMSESGLPEGRIKGERGRTCNQLKMFADLVEEGSWVQATIDEALPERTPARSDIRLMKRAVGPVVVFTASNFPLAFSTAGGDTASAFAAGCPVIVKAHPAHPGTNALVSKAINQAVTENNLPAGTYSSLYDDGHTVGSALVLHPDVCSVAFTGSHAGGLALHSLAQKRKNPIPVFAEMGSINPVFILDEILEKDPNALASKIAFSVNMGAGQFCTNPGIQVVNKKHAQTYLSELAISFEKLDSFTMLTEGIYNNYKAKRDKCIGSENVHLNHATDFTDEWKASPAVAHVSAENFINKPNLHQEIFGPFSLVVICENKDEMIDVAKAMEGQLTATIFGTIEELKKHAQLSQCLENITGRLIYNGVPTGVEVGHAMHHGGPFPASTDSRFTSVGADSLYRFVRPVCYQDCPDELLPSELQQSNPNNIIRKVNGKIIAS